jgi:hypothetical protein
VVAFIHSGIPISGGFLRVEVKLKRAKVTTVSTRIKIDFLKIL